MQTRFIVLALFLLLIFPTLFAEEEEEESDTEFSASVEAGGGYDSNVKTVDGNTSGTGAAVVSGVADFQLTVKDFSVGYAVSADWLPDAYDLSRVDNELSVDYQFPFESSDLTLTLITHHSMSDFDEVKNDILDFTLLADYFLEHDEDLATYFSFTGGYNYGMEDMDFFRGVFVGVEVGEYIYFGEGNDYFRLSGKFNAGFMGEKVSEDFDSQVTLWTTPNRNIAAEAKARMAKAISNFQFITELKYQYKYWLDKDEWFIERSTTETERVKKRRIDNIISAGMVFRYSFLKRFSLELNYDIEKVISTIGQDKTVEEGGFDAGDMNDLRHAVKGVIGCSF